MNTNDLQCAQGGLLPDRKFRGLAMARSSSSFNNEFVRAGSIYCWVGDSDQDKVLVVIEERTLEINARTTIRGYNVAYVDESFVLFVCDENNAVLVDANTLQIIGGKLLVPDVLIPLSFKADSEMLCEYQIGKYFALFQWPSMHKIWEYENNQSSRASVVLENYLYIINSKNLKKIDVSTGNLIWEKPSNDWMSDSQYPKTRITKNLKIRTEATGIVADTLALSLDPTVMVGIDINTGDIRWSIDITGPQKLRVTQDGIGWFIRDENIYRLDIAKGELLPPLPIQFSPALEKPVSAQVGAFDMSTTHLIAEVSSRTSAGYTVGHIVGIRRDNGVCEWAVPIEGTVTKLYLLNNRIHATGTFMGADIAKPTSQTLIIEGEGGYIPD